MAADVNHRWIGTTTHKILVVTVLLLVVVITFIRSNSDLSTGKYFSATFVAKGNATQDSTNHTSSSSRRPESTVVLILQRLLRDKYPECQLSPTLFASSSTTSTSSVPSINLSTMGFYQNASDPTPPYDHLSCFLMKARYNCAYRPNAPFDMAHKYELVLQLPNRTKPCHLKALIAETLLEWNTALKKERNNEQFQQEPKQRRRKYHVMIHGNSYLRQIFEALVCKVMPKLTLSSSSSSSDNNDIHNDVNKQQSLVPPITDFSVQLGGPGISVSDVTARGNRRIEVDELGQPLTNWTLLQTLGCHGEGQSDISAYYRRKAIAPPNLAHCNDNIGMIELGQEWRFCYIFQPTMYSTNALETIYQQRFGFSTTTNNNHNNSATSTTMDTNHNHNINNEDDMVWLLWNSVRKEAQNITVATSTTSSILLRQQQWSLESWLWTLRDLQLRDMGKYFGANNPWIAHPPDYHACMPGTPDDQVNLMLYLLWSGYKMEQ